MNTKLASMKTIKGRTRKPSLKARESTEKKTKKIIHIASSVSDRSGSMQSCRGSQYEGFKTFWGDRWKDSETSGAELFGMYSSFDDISEIWSKNEDEKDGFEKITKAPNFPDTEIFKMLRPRGCTRLIDTFNEQIHMLEEFYIDMKKKNPDADIRVSFVLQTDGENNIGPNLEKDETVHQANDRIKTKIAATIRRLEKEGATILFLGAGIDAIKTAATYGVSSSHTLQTGLDPNSSANAYKCFSAAVSRGMTQECSVPIPVSFTGLERAQSQAQYNHSPPNFDDYNSSPPLICGSPVLAPFGGLKKFAHDDLSSTSAAAMLLKNKTGSWLLRKSTTHGCFAWSYNTNGIITHHLITDKIITELAAMRFAIMEMETEFKKKNLTFNWNNNFISPDGRPICKPIAFNTILPPPPPLLRLPQLGLLNDPFLPIPPPPHMNTLTLI
jgi:hypothetical protein